MFGRFGKKAARHDTITAFLGPGAEYRGQFRFQGIARVDGSVIGDIVSDGTLVLGEEGRIEGSVRVAELVANGRIVGDVAASRRVVLSRRADLRGDLLAPVVIVEDGAVLNGAVRMTEPSELPLLPPGEEGGPAGNGDGPEAGN